MSDLVPIVLSLASMIAAGLPKIVDLFTQIWRGLN